MLQVRPKRTIEASGPLTVAPRYLPPPQGDDVPQHAAMQLSTAKSTPGGGHFSKASIPSVVPPPAGAKIQAPPVVPALTGCPAKPLQDHPPVQAKLQSKGPPQLQPTLQSPPPVGQHRVKATSKVKGAGVTYQDEVGSKVVAAKLVLPPVSGSLDERSAKPLQPKVLLPAGVGESAEAISKVPVKSVVPFVDAMAIANALAVMAGSDAKSKASVTQSAPQSMLGFAKLPAIASTELVVKAVPIKAAAPNIEPIENTPEKVLPPPPPPSDPPPSDPPPPPPSTYAVDASWQEPGRPQNHLEGEGGSVHDTRWKHWSSQRNGSTHERHWNRWHNDDGKSWRGRHASWDEKKDGQWSSNSWNNWGHGGGETEARSADLDEARSQDSQWPPPKPPALPESTGAGITEVTAHAASEKQVERDEAVPRLRPVPPKTPPPNWARKVPADPQDEPRSLGEPSALQREGIVAARALLEGGIQTEEAAEDQRNPEPRQQAAEPRHQAAKAVSRSRSRSRRFGRFASEQRRRGQSPRRRRAPVKTFTFEPAETFEERSTTGVASQQETPTPSLAGSSAATGSGNAIASTTHRQSSAEAKDLQAASGTPGLSPAAAPSSPRPRAAEASPPRAAPGSSRADSRADSGSQMPEKGAEQPQANESSRPSAAGLIYETERPEASVNSMSPQSAPSILVRKRPRLDSEEPGMPISHMLKQRSEREPRLEPLPAAPVYERETPAEVRRPRLRERGKRISDGEDQLAAGRPLGARRTKELRGSVIERASTPEQRPVERAARHSPPAVREGDWTKLDASQGLRLKPDRLKLWPYSEKARNHTNLELPLSWASVRQLQRAVVDEFPSPKRPDYCSPSKVAQDLQYLREKQAALIAQAEQRNLRDDVDTELEELERRTAPRGAAVHRDRPLGRPRRVQVEHDHREDRHGGRLRHRRLRERSRSHDFRTRGRDARREPPSPPSARQPSYSNERCARTATSSRRQAQEDGGSHGDELHDTNRRTLLDRPVMDTTSDLNGDDDIRRGIQRRPKEQDAEVSAVPLSGAWYLDTMPDGRMGVRLLCRNRDQGSQWALWAASHREKGLQVPFLCSTERQCHLHVFFKKAEATRCSLQIRCTQRNGSENCEAYVMEVLNILRGMPSIATITCPGCRHTELDFELHSTTPAHAAAGRKHQSGMSIAEADAEAHAVASRTAPAPIDFSQPAAAPVQTMEEDTAPPAAQEAVADEGVAENDTNAFVEGQEVEARDEGGTWNLATVLVPGTEKTAVKWKHDGTMAIVPRNDVREISRATASLEAPAAVLQPAQIPSQASQPTQAPTAVVQAPTAAAHTIQQPAMAPPHIAVASSAVWQPAAPWQTAPAPASAWQSVPVAVAPWQTAPTADLAWQTAPATTGVWQCAVGTPAAAATWQTSPAPAASSTSHIEPVVQAEALTHAAPESAAELVGQSTDQRGSDVRRWVKSLRGIPSEHSAALEEVLVSSCSNMERIETLYCHCPGFPDTRSFFEDLSSLEKGCGEGKATLVSEDRRVIAALREGLVHLSYHSKAAPGMQPQLIPAMQPHATMLAPGLGYQHAALQHPVHAQAAVAWPPQQSGMIWTQPQPQPIAAMPWPTQYAVPPLQVQTQPQIQPQGAAMAQATSNTSQNRTPAMLQEELGTIRADKQAAIAAEDFDRAKTLKSRETELQAQLDEVEVQSQGVSQVLHQQAIGVGWSGLPVSYPAPTEQVVTTLALQPAPW